MYKLTALDNGLRVLSHRMPKMDSVSCGIWIRAGSRYEENELQGIAHFMEHLAFKGTKKRSGRKLKELIEGVGGSLNGFTSEEFSCYLVKILGEHLPLALDVLSDMVANPLLKSEDVNKERSVIMEEIKMYRDIPAHLVHDILDSLMWPGHPLGRPLVGTFETIHKIERKDLRAFKSSFYTPSNIAVVVCGALDHHELLDSAGRYFGKLAPGERHDFEEVRIKQRKPCSRILFKETEQTHISLGFHSYHRKHPKRHALNLLHIILGGGMSSRLFWKIREKKGLAYEISTQVVKFNDTGAFLVNAGVDNRKTEKALELILSELKRIKQKPVNEDEFRRAKEFYRGQFLLGIEDTTDFMLWLGENLVCQDKIYTPAEILEQIKNVRRSEIRDAANEILKADRLSLAAVGPVREKSAKDMDTMLASFAG